MKREHLRYLVCPTCQSALKIGRVQKETKSSIESGELNCVSCKKTYPIVRHIPRFVPHENYAAGFGFQWNKHSKTQYDSYSGANISEKRFFEETKWSRKLPGEIILEVGSGSGRFTEQAASTGAMVVSLDYSSAVEANYASNGNKENVLIVQGNIYSMPFRKQFFDNVLCIGVIQHTPDPKRAFFSLPQYLKKNGSLVVDVYRFSWWRYPLTTRYWIRPITKHMSSERLYRFCERYVSALWPVTCLLNKLPGGRYLSKMLLVPNYSGLYPLSNKMLKEWAVLDMFDNLSPRYDKPQSLRTVARWFKEARLKNVDVRYGYNGIEGRGMK